MTATAAAVSVKDQVSPEEWKTRLDLAAAYRMIARNGWDDLIFTHLSARVPGPDHHFLLNPFGLLFEEVTASNLVKIDLKGKVVMASPYMVNAAGFVIHSCIHEARPDVLSVMHTHTVAGIAVSAQKDGLLPLSQTAMTLSGEISYHDYEGLALEDAEKPRLVADLGDKRAMILRNHGLLAAGRSIGEAYLILAMLEKACAIQVAAQGRDVILQPDSMGHRVHNQAVHGFGMAAAIVWDGLKRKLDREDPSYAQ